MFKKGNSGNPAGRPPGAKDKNQSDIKAKFQSIIELKLSNIETWLDEVATDNPAKALELIIKLSEFVLPKMKATEIAGIESFTSPRTLTKVEARELWVDFDNGKFPSN